MKPQVSIVIVHYQNRRLLYRCLDSLKQARPQPAFETIVVDNDETPTIEKALKRKFPRVKYVKSPGNVGYAAGNNLGAKLARGKYLFILNPDTRLLPGTLEALVRFLQSKPKAAAAAPLLVDAKFKPYPLQGTSRLTPLKAIFSLTLLNRLWPKNPVAQQYWENWPAETDPAPRQVEVVPGSAFLIKTSVFKQLKGFDENFFLYFEESDLGQRLKAKGYRLFILPQAKLVHYWQGSTPQTAPTRAIFAASRRYYFNKHFGIFSMWLVELATGLTPANLGLFFILALAAWLRFFHLPELMMFIGDQGRDYLAARDMVLTGSIPLVGIDSSVPWLKQGPFFIWLTALALKLTNFNPVAPAIVTATLGVLTVYLTYRLARYWFKASAALAASLALATSPLSVIHSRMPYHTSPIPLISLLFIFSLYFWVKNKLPLFWPVLLWAALVQFELTTAPLILVLVLGAYLKRRLPEKRQLLLAAAAFLLPWLPKIIYDFSHQFSQTLGFAAWLGYRFLSFFGYSQRHTVSPASLRQVTLTIFNYWQKFILWDSPGLALALVLILVLVLAKRFRLKPLSLKLKLLLAFILVNLVAFYFHGAPSEAYFPVLFPAWALALAWLTDKIKPKALVYSLLLALAFYNSWYLASRRFIPRGPTLSQRIEVTKFIALNAPGQSFKLKNPSYIGFASYLDNYRYLLWWLGSPEDPAADLTYQIDEAPAETFSPARGATVFHFENIQVLKYE